MDSSSDFSEFEQTSSAMWPVRWTAVGRAGPHLVQPHRHAAPGDLPGGLAAGQARADDGHRPFRHRSSAGCGSRRAVRPKAMIAQAFA